PGALEQADWIVLPGSKQTSGDLAWLRAAGLEPPIARHAARGGRVLGICGGLQMLGEALTDPDGVDGAPRGLGLLPLETVFAPDKLLRRTRARFTSPGGAWSALAEVAFEGYEIRHGRTAPRPGEAATVTVALRDEAGAPIGWQRDNVLGLSAHGLFESAAVMGRLFGARPRPLDEVFEGLADFIDRRFAPGALLALAGQAARSRASDAGS
ncbi:MAG TPA: cobyric acid synthase CobQ, partial [Polyangia bacterium]|nr:cobyric acid synthase CobQ [Polyangia bacterium]